MYGMMSLSKRAFLSIFILLFGLTHPSTSSLVLSMSSSEISESVSRKLTSHANSYAAAHGLQVETKKDSTPSSSSSTTSYQCAPISLLPNIFPAASFQKAQSLAPSFNMLVDRISRDETFLKKTLNGVKEYDSYTRKLLELYEDIYCTNDKKRANFARTADRLGIHRSDYMLNKNDDESSYGIKQIELNTIASSFAGLAVNVAGLHRQLTTRYNVETKDWMEYNKRCVMDKEMPATENEGVPTNPALDRLPHAMSLAHKNYCQRFKEEGDCVILFVVQDGETNTVDQRMLEIQLWEKHQIPVVRMSLTQADKNIAFDDETGAIYVIDDECGRQEVSLVYFRAGYAPSDYPDGDDGIEWKSRDKIERSRATKCPCLGYHLAGTKKIQQELARDGAVERFFFDDPKTSADVDVKGMRSAFAGLYSLGDDATEADLEAVKDAINGNGGNYVLKPQREGGGYNFYGSDLVDKLLENCHQDSDDGKIQLQESLAEFILMERLFPPQQRAILLRSGAIEGIGDSISEFGCFGTILASHDGSIIHNEYAGFLLRTKFSNVDEGGVASGFATLSSPYLY